MSKKDATPFFKVGVNEHCNVSFDLPKMLAHGHSICGARLLTPFMNFVGLGGIPSKFGF